MTNKTFADKVKASFNGHEYQYNIIIEGESVYFRYDTDDSTPKENFSVYCEIQEDLAKFGYTIDDVYIEHDCISGYLKEITK